uniref:SLPTX16 n=1 Tax=Hemiscolopendra marginata TaxID=943146 RepID=A0A646QCL1_9MYRI
MMCSTTKDALLVIVIVSACIAETFGWTAIGKIDIKDGKCDPKNGKLYAIGEKWYNDEDCFEITCIQGDKGSVAQEIASCPVHAEEPGCELKFPKGQKYPKCCPVYECPKKLDSTISL